MDELTEAELTLLVEALLALQRAAWAKQGALVDNNEPTQAALDYHATLGERIDAIDDLMTKVQSARP